MEETVGRDDAGGDVGMMAEVADDVVSVSTFLLKGSNGNNLN